MEPKRKWWLSWLRRVCDYSLLLSTSVLTYKFLVGCILFFPSLFLAALTLPPAARFNVLDDNKKDSDGRILLTKDNPCTTVSVPGLIQYQNKNVFAEGSAIQWSVLDAGGFNVQQTGDSFAICQKEGERVVYFESVLLEGKYFTVDHNGTKVERVIERRVPLSSFE